MASNVAFDLSELTGDQLRNLIEAAQEILEPEAVIEDGELVCKCGHREPEPKLFEIGYHVNHTLLSIDGKTITCEGWDGSSSETSESGDMLLLECPECYATYRVPEDLEVNWV